MFKVRPRRIRQVHRILPGVGVGVQPLRAGDLRDRVGLAEAALRWVVIAQPDLVDTGLAVELLAGQLPL
jgi:hypothetical protein